MHKLYLERSWKVSQKNLKFLVLFFHTFPSTFPFRNGSRFSMKFINPSKRLVYSKSLWMSGKRENYIEAGYSLLSDVVTQTV